MIKRIFYLFFTIIVLFAFVSCSGEENNPSIPGIMDTKTRPTHSYDETTTREAYVIADNDTWKTNYKITYSFLKNAQTSVITEVRLDNKYLIKAEGSDFFNYYTTNTKVASSVDSYMLYPATKKGTRVIIANASMSELESGFMSISKLAPNFASLSNVKLDSVNTVAGRSCKKYVMTQLDTAGKLQKYANIWIDDEFGFAIKSEVCLSDNTIVSGWEVTEFLSGSITTSDIGVKVSDYDVTLSTGAVETTGMPATTQSKAATTKTVTTTATATTAAVTTGTE